jgi:hypothetical protein
MIEFDWRDRLKMSSVAALRPTKLIGAVPINSKFGIFFVFGLPLAIDIGPTVAVSDCKGEWLCLAGEVPL